MELAGCENCKIWNKQQHRAGAQQGIIEGRGPIHEKGYTKTFEEDTGVEYRSADS